MSLTSSGGEQANSTAGMIGGVPTGASGGGPGGVPRGDRSPVLGEARTRRQGMRAALSELELALAAPARGRAPQWAAHVAERVVELKQAFDRHVAVTEEPDGLFDEILSIAPRLSRRVEKLRSEHPSIQNSIEKSLAILESPVAFDDERAASAREAALGVLALLARHRHLGSDLVWEAYNVDIDAAD